MPTALRPRAALSSRSESESREQRALRLRRARLASSPSQTAPHLTPLAIREPLVARLRLENILIFYYLNQAPAYPQEFPSPDGFLNSILDTIICVAVVTYHYSIQQPKDIRSSPVKSRQHTRVQYNEIMLQQFMKSSRFEGVKILSQ